MMAPTRSLRSATWTLALTLAGCGGGGGDTGTDGGGASREGSAASDDVSTTGADSGTSTSSDAGTDATMQGADTAEPLEGGRDQSAPDGHAGLAPMPIISFGVPAYASSGTASDANDDSYDTVWRSSEMTSSSTPSWLAYDLSSVPAAERGPVDIVWDNGNGGYNEYDIAAKPDAAATNQPRDYTFEANAAPGGSLPGSGWVTIVTVSGNTYLSREHPVNLTGYNWLRMTVTAINGGMSNENTALNLDVHDASNGITDAWLFLGDSITAFAMRNDGAGIGAKSFPELINASKPAYFPASEGAGEGSWTSDTPLTTASPDGTGSIFDHWLTTFPGKFVCLSYGTNDGTDGSGDATPTYDNFVTMVKKVIAAGKTPCIPHVPWAEDASHQMNAQLINAKLDMLYNQYPDVVKGPDLWAALLNQTDLYQDNLHPNPQGREVYRQAWATAMLSEVYP
jgi:hypothetical protein